MRSSHTRSRSQCRQAGGGVSAGAAGGVVSAAALMISACASTDGRIDIDRASASSTQPSLSSPSSERGAKVYVDFCASCHGKRGDGDGVAAEGLDPQPRDFSRGVYCYRSTPTGSLPTAADLIRTVRLGLPTTAMPSWEGIVTAQQIVDVVAFIKTLTVRFTDEEIDESIAIPEPLPMSEASVARGKAAYEKVQCGKCHGSAGRGDGWASETEMRDDAGRVVRPRDFTQGVYRSGRTKQDIYRTFYTGLDGTPMPGYENSLAPTEIYDLVNYLLSLEQPRGLWRWLITPPRWYEPGAHRVPR